MSWVQTVAGRVNTEWARDDGADRRKYDALLARAHGSPATCLCNKEEAPIAIRRLSERRYALARYSETGLKHEEDCGFYGDPRIGDGLQSRYEGAVKRGDDGELRIALAIPIGPSKKIEDDVRGTEEYRANGLRPRVVRGKMTLLGLLYLLWEEAHLNRWSPASRDKRTENHVSLFLGNAAESMHIARAALGDQLLFLVRRPSEGQRKFAWRRFFGVKEGRRALVLVGTLDDHGTVAERWTRAMQPYGFRAMLSPEVAARAERSYKRILNASTGNRVFTAVLRPGAHTSEVEQIVLMHTSSAWIPVDSSYEFTFADTAVAEGRRFYKPLRLDGAERLPDFVLTDTVPHTECEVFGRDDADYVERAEEKKRNPHLWYWDAVTEATMPSLPQASQRGAA